MGNAFSIKRVFNNNAVLVSDSEKEEHVLLGKGIAFNKKIGDLVNEEKAEKNFSLNNQNNQRDKIFGLLREIPSHHISLVTTIIEMAQNELETSFDDELFVSLADHISFAIKRYKKGIQLPNSLLYDIRKMYPKEFETAKKAVGIINYNERIELDDNEASFIAMHFINSGINIAAFDEIIAQQKVVEDIVAIIESDFSVSIDPKSLNYNRLIVHIQFFVKRVMKEEKLASVDLMVVSDNLFANEKISSCIEKVSLYVKQNLNFDVTDEEKLFLCIHLNRILTR